MSNKNLLNNTYARRDIRKKNLLETQSVFQTPA